MLAGNYSSAADEAFNFKQVDLPSPAITVLGYPALPYSYNKNNAPTYVVMSEDDDVIPITDVKERVEKMRDVGIDVYFNVYNHVGHGFGAAQKTEENGWIQGAISFWREHMK